MKEFGRSLPGKHLIPRYFNIDQYERQKYGLISMCILSFDTSTSSKAVPVITPQPLRAVGVLFSPMVSGWAGGRAAGNSLSGLYLRNGKVYEVDTWYGHWLGCVGVQCYGLTLI